VGFREAFADGHPGFIDMKGKRCGVVVVVGRVENNGAGTARWKCRCDCGAVFVKTGISLRAKPPKSCKSHRERRS